MANEFRYGIDQNGVRHPVCDDTRVDWSSYALLGAKNIFDIEGWLKSNGVTFTKSGNVYTFTPNTNLYNNHYIISDSDIDVILSSVITPTEGSIADNIGFEMFDSQNRQITSRGNSGSGKVSWLRMNWTTYGEITIETPMIRLASDPDPTHAPYAMTNEELTKKVTFNNVEITNVNAGITLDGAWSYAYQIGNLVIYALRFTVGASAINENTILCSFGAECSKSMNADILPRQTGNHFLAALVADTTNHRTDFKTFGGATLTASNEYLVSGVYIAK